MESQFFYYLSYPKPFPRAGASPDELLQGRTWARLCCMIDAAILEQCLIVHLKNLSLSGPGAFRKKQVSGSFVHSLVGADTSAFGRSSVCSVFPDKAAPGAEHFHQLLSLHVLVGGPGVGNVMVNPPCPGFSTS